MQLAGRVVLITGAARRIGRAIALRLAQAGCDLALHYRKSADEAANTAAACRAAGVRAELFACDLADPTAAAALVAAVRTQLGQLDVLINSASVFARMDLASFDVTAWERTLRVNLTAPAVLIHAASDELKRRNGRVINLGDAGAQRAWPDYWAYCVSKSGLEMLTRVAARALAPEVNVVGIAPGVAAWPEDFPTDLRQRLTTKIPLGRVGTPEEVAAVAHFLLSEGDYLTGLTIPVDGGRHMV